MAEPLSRAEWRRRRRRKVIIIRTVVFSVLALILGIIIYLIGSGIHNIVKHEEIGTLLVAGNTQVHAELLTKNEYSRPGKWMEKKKVKGVVIHAADAAGVTASARRNYYELLGSTKANHLSSHFVVGTDGEIIQCVPMNEIALASGSRNVDTIAIEYCFDTPIASLSPKAYDSLVNLLATLVNRFGLKAEQLYRHMDVTELTGESQAASCPLGLSDEATWTDFKTAVMLKAEELKKKK